MSRKFENGKTVMFVIVAGKAAGLMSVADPLKNTTPKAIKELYKEGVNIVMLTWDKQKTADAVARKLQIDKVEADVLPDQKA